MAFSPETPTGATQRQGSRVVSDDRDTRAIEHPARFEQSAMPQVTCDLQGLLRHANDAFCSLIGRSRKDLVGRPIAELNHETDGGEADSGLRMLLSEQAEVGTFERVMRGPGGRAVPARIDVTLLRNSEGAAIGAAAFVQDLRQLKDAEQRQLQLESFFHALSERASDLAIVADPDGLLIFISPAIESMLGFKPAERLFTPGWDFVHPEDLAAVEEVFGAVVGDGRTRTVTLRIRAADGTWRHVEETMANLVDTPVGGVVCNLRDVTAQVEAQRALEASEARYRAIVENADEGIWVASREGRTTFVNSRMLDILGLSAEQVHGRSPADMLDGPAAQRVMTGLGNRKNRGAERYEVDYRHPDGTIRHLSISATPLQDDTGFEGSLALVSDITASRSAVLSLQHAAAHDVLTELPNRSELERGVTSALGRSPETTAVLFIDLDHFKVVNDARGHGAGDDLLREVARRLQAAVQPEDMVARFGGDEFVVVCEGVTAADALAVAGRLLAALEEQKQGAGGRLHASASIGIALSPAESAEQLLRKADAAMYAAKNAGRRTVRFFDDSLASSAEERYQLSHDLRVALKGSELCLAYQPVVDLRTGEVLGAEGLARWEHPSLGPVAPDRFVPVALENGFAAELDFWAVRRAAQDLATFRTARAAGPDTYVAVNLSSRTLDHPAFFDELEQAILEHGLRPQDLLLEVTEATVVTRAGEGMATLQRLVEAGHRVAIDDFGTGHSALAYLQDLPATMLKIDRSFVTELTTSPAARTIAEAIVNLGHGLQMQVVAEGVEDSAQAELLRALGCDSGQGWLWSRAVSRGDVLAEDWLRRSY